MSATDDARAVGAARAATGAGPDVPSRVEVVRRLDRPVTYRLVFLGRPGESGWVAAVGEDGAVLSWAASATGLATVPAGSGELCWWPSARTASALYPVRRIGPDTFVGLDGRPVTGPAEG
ncbi:MAG: hypothetical protein QM779_02725 [Propionicimonas sp.]|uniref:hypothetical protein n=1 Tax=Propionicimonas sp. TaxID=1955623 RepID=UPI003D151B53